MSCLYSFSAYSATAASSWSVLLLIVAMTKGKQIIEIYDVGILNSVRKSLEKIAKSARAKSHLHMTFIRGSQRRESRAYLVTTAAFWNDV